MERLVVVGAGLAGMRAAQAARAGGHEGELLVVGEEPHPPYTRPPLSKELLAGTQTPEQCALPQAGIEVSWRLGVAAVGLDRARHEVRLGDGETLSYDRLILATGCRARPWPSEGGELEGVLTLRGLDDALALRSALQAGGRLLIIGAGFVGCEVAATARSLGVEVTLVDVAPHPMLPLGPELGSRWATLHRSHGVDLRLETGVAALRGASRVSGAELTDGSSVEAGTVLVAMGSLPNVEWLRDSGLALETGVSCDATLTAVDDPDVLAAGDIAAWPHPLNPAGRARVEHWTIAAEHGALAGRNALLDPAERAPHTAPPYFWSDQYETKIQALGFPGLVDRLEVLESDETGERLVAAGAREGRLVAVVAFNAARRLMLYRRALLDPPDLAALREQVLADEKALGAPRAA